MKRSILTTLALACLAVLMPSAINVARGDDYPYGGPYWGDRSAPRHSSTVEEGKWRGRADFARAVGDYNVNTSQARLLYEQAREKYMDNRLRWVSTRYEMRKINDAYRRSQRPPRATKEEMVSFAAMNDPERLAAHQVHPATGELEWPAALQGKQFADEREELEALWAEYRSLSYGARSSVQSQAQAVADEMTDQLGERIRSLEPAQWIEAKDFLASVPHEMKFAPQSGLALSQR